LRSFESLSKSIPHVADPKNLKPFAKFFRAENVTERKSARASEV